VDWAGSDCRHIPPETPVNIPVPMACILLFKVISPASWTPTPQIGCPVVAVKFLAIDDNTLFRHPAWREAGQRPRFVFEKDMEGSISLPLNDIRQLKS
jgi:hypothetical protein